jgi:hypothetical protein
VGVSSLKRPGVCGGMGGGGISLNMIMNVQEKRCIMLYKECVSIFWGGNANMFRINSTTIYGK